MPPSASLRRATRSVGTIRRLFPDNLSILLDTSDPYHCGWPPIFGCHRAADMPQCERSIRSSAHSTKILTAGADWPQDRLSPNSSFRQRDQESSDASGALSPQRLFERQEQPAAAESALTGAPD